MLDRLGPIKGLNENTTLFQEDLNIKADQSRPVTIEDLQKLLEQFRRGFDEEVEERRQMKDILRTIIMDPAPAFPDKGSPNAHIRYKR